MKSILLAVLAFLFEVHSLNLQCSSTSSTCPANSNCASNNYCVCNSGWIGNCSTPAVPLSSAPINVTLNPQTTTFFSAVPQQLGVGVQFQYVINQSLNPGNYNFTLWGQTGNISSYTSSNELGRPSSESFNSNSTYNLYTYYYNFGDQPNGQPQMMILGILSLNSVAATMQISVQQNIAASTNIFYYITIGLISVIGIAFLVGLAVCAYLRRRRRIEMQGGAHPNGRQSIREYHDIAYFQNFMPCCTASKLNAHQYLSAPCAICLSSIEPSDIVRKTPCTHIFHSTCIDAWCLKTLNCPVCRMDFSLEKLSAGFNRSSSTYSNNGSNANNDNSSNIVNNSVAPIVPQQQVYRQSLDRQESVDMGEPIDYGIVGNGIRQSML